MIRANSIQAQLEILKTLGRAKVKVSTLILDLMFKELQQKFATLITFMLAKLFYSPL